VFLVCLCCECLAQSRCLVQGAFQVPKSGRSSSALACRSIEEEDEDDANNNNDDDNNMYNSSLTGTKYQLQMNCLMLLGDIIAMYCQNNTKRTHALCRQNAESIRLKKMVHSVANVLEWVN
jgi:hypothetical protein